VYGGLNCDRRVGDNAKFSVYEGERILAFWRA
jgi:hypothetical protein